LTLELAAAELNAALLAGSSELASTLVVLCRGGDDAIASMDHLAGQLRLKTVVASLEAVPLDAIRQQPKFSGQALLLSPNAAESAPVGDNAQLLWYLGGRYNDAVSVYTALLRRLQGMIEPKLMPRRGLRIASLTSKAREDLLLSAAVERALDLDGRDANYLFREDRFRRFALAEDSPDARAEVPAAVAAYAPDLILVFAGGEFRAPRGAPRLGVLRDIEEQVVDGSSWSPFYVLGPRALGDDATAQLTASNERFSASAVAVSIDRGPDPELGDELLERYASAYPDALIANLYPAFNVYDAFYHISYALAAARTRSPVISAEAVMDGLTRVTDPHADCVEVGPRGFAAATERIRASTPFQLCGVTGSARFARDHARGGQANLFCWTGSSLDGDCTSVFARLESAQ
jgi:hypothetical protein